MNLRSLAVAGATTAIVAASALAPSAAFADPRVSFSASTVCPGEFVMLTFDGFTDGTVVPLTAPEYAAVWSSNNPTPYVLETVGYNGSFPYGAFTSVALGQTYTYAIVTASNGTDPLTIQSIVSSASIQVLAECGSPAPEPAAESLPDTGASASTMGALALGAAALGLGGAALARRARRTTASN
jgi:LPXTG-motif cell wall-anchored protein